MKANRAASFLFILLVTGPGTLAPGTAFSQTVARLWNEQNLAAIRIDFPDPAVHARNLFHTSVAMWDAWAAYDATALGYVHRENATAADVEAARQEAISYAAYRVLVHRYQGSVGATATLAALNQQMTDLGFPPTNTSTTGPSPEAVGNRVAEAVLAFALTDGSNEAGDYEDPTYTPLNEPMILDLPFELMTEANYWQPLAFEFAVTQNGLEAEKVQTFLGSHWGDVRPFALHRAPGEALYYDPGEPPKLGGSGDADFKNNSVDVIRFSRLLDPLETSDVDCSPGAVGNNNLGLNDGTGHRKNPATGMSYAPNLVNQADFGRVLAEFWADGPDSETPPGHWNNIANEVADALVFPRQIAGAGGPVERLEWDVKAYFAINGSVHDAAVAAWGCKRYYDYVRPISSIRQMCLRGQSSDPGDISTYDVAGIPLEPGLVEVITNDSIMTGERHAHLAPHVGKIAIYCWGGEPADATTEFTGNKWILGSRWLPYQRDTFVTPAFAGYISGHSTFSRAAAEVLTAMTASAFFPGGISSYTVPAGDLEFEYGPEEPVTLEWATYYDAADQAGISRIYGGIHVAPDDGPGRVVGSLCGIGAWELAQKYFDGSIVDERFPVEINSLANGDLEINWGQIRGFFYRLESASNLTGFTPMDGFTRAGDDRGVMTIPGASLGTARFYRAGRSPVMAP